MGCYSIVLAEASAVDAFLLRRGFQFSAEAKFLEVLSNGRQVVDYFRGIGSFADRRQHPIPDLLILDLRLPKKSGFEVLEELRRLDGPKPRRVTVLTGFATAADILRAYELGAHFIAPKTPNFAPFVQRVQRLMLEEAC